MVCKIYLEAMKRHNINQLNKIKKNSVEKEQTFHFVKTRGTKGSINA